MGSPYGVEGGAGGAYGCSEIEGEGGDAVLAVGCVVEDAADEAVGVMGADRRARRAVEAAQVPGEGV